MPEEVHIGGRGGVGVPAEPFFLPAVPLFFIGFLGEYVLSINTRVLDRPLVVEEERLNFDEEETEKEEDTQ